MGPERSLEDVRAAIEKLGPARKVCRECPYVAGTWTSGRQVKIFDSPGEAFEACSCDAPLSAHGFSVVISESRMIQPHERVR